MADERKQEALLHDSAAEHNSLRRKGTNPIGKTKREIVSLEYPTWMVAREFRCRYTPSFLHGWTGCEAFKTVAVEGAAPWIRIALPIMRDSSVPHFRME